MTYDKRWTAIVQDWLEDGDVPAELIERYQARCCQQLQDLAETFFDDIRQSESERDDMLRDRHEQRQIDEAMGK